MGSIPRLSLSGNAANRLRIKRQARRRPLLRFLAKKRKPSLSHFAGILCCPWTIVSTRCSQHYRLPDVEGEKPAKKRFKRYPIGYFHVDLAEVRTAEGKLYLFVAIDRTSKFAFARLVPKAGKLAAAQFLRDLIAMVPYRINIVLTELPMVAPLVRATIGDGIQFTNRKRDTSAFEHAFDRVCREHQIEHRLTKVKDPWTNGQVERMNRTIKEATVKRFHYDSHQQLENHLADFLDAYNYARRLKTLSGLTPYEFICKTWTSHPERFTLNPCHQMPGLNTLSAVQQI